MAASTTKNYNWTEIDPDGEIDIATDVNTPLEQIDASLKELQDSAKSYTFQDGITESSGVVGLDVPIRKGSGTNSIIGVAVTGTPTDVNKARGENAVAIGARATANGMNSIAVGISASVSESAENGIAIGSNVTCTGANAVALGTLSEASGNGSVAVCNGSARANGSFAASHARTIKSSYRPNDAYNNTAVSQADALGKYSFAGGINSKANGYCSIALGYNCRAGESDVDEDHEIAKEYGCQIAEGARTEAKGQGSHAEGYRTIANGTGQHAGGVLNIEHATSDILEVIGNGTEDSLGYVKTRSDARTLAFDGTQWNAGDLTCDAVQGNHDKLYSLRQVAAFVETLPAMEFGTSNTVTVPAVSQATVDVTFGSAKTEAPVLFVNLQHSAAYGDLTWYVQSVTNQQAAIVVVNNGSEDATDITVDWLAISGR